jgi:glycosyltransferase involved in cell wall biosynthesis
MKIAVIIPCFKVRTHILDLVSEVLKYEYTIYLIDDACPENSGDYVAENIKNERLNIIYNTQNLGVGGAVKKGFSIALENDFDIFVKLDGDGQMKPEFIQTLIQPLINEIADFTKGNRFFNVNQVKKMPLIRLMGNSALSFINKFVNGYWQIMDPTNGFIALNKVTLSQLEIDKLSNRYFFESDLLFRLGIIRAVVFDFPMEPNYGNEKSNLSVFRTLISFPPKYIKRFFKRIIYLYFLRDFNVGSLHLISGSLLFLFGLVFGIFKWVIHVQNHESTPTGTIMIATLSIILGFQLLLSFLNYDINNYPKEPLVKLYKNKGF